MTLADGLARTSTGTRPARIGIVTRESELREEILEAHARVLDVAFPEKSFVGGISQIPVSGKVFDGEEMTNLVDASLDFWLTTGRYAGSLREAFRKGHGGPARVAVQLGLVRELLAITALTSPRLGKRRLVEGDEVITVAAGFPTTVNPIYQNRLTPVFVDAELGTYDANIDMVREAVGPKTRAIVMAHTLGNPFDLGSVMEIAAEHDLWVVEDSCDAVGATYDGKPVGSFGHLATTSFYPAHHITMGEGGCVLTQKKPMRKIIESLPRLGPRLLVRARGREHVQPALRLAAWRSSDGYDHKYTYSHIGYNLKMTDMQAAVGVAQLAKLPSFIERRKANWQRLRDGVADLEETSCAGRDAEIRAQLVRLPADRAGDRAVHSFRLRRPPRGAPDRDSAPVRRNLLRQPAYAGLPAASSATS